MNNKAQSENVDVEQSVDVDIELQDDVSELSKALNKLNKKFKKLKSKVWNFFEILSLGEDKKLKSACKKCGQQYLASSKYGTGNMLKHIKNCPKSDTRDIGQMLIVRDTGSLSSSSCQFNSEKWRELVTSCIVLHDLPFQFVKYRGVRAMLTYLYADVELVSRNIAKADTLKLYQRENVKVKNMLDLCPGRISLTSDLWSSLTTDGYICLTGHFIDENWKLHKKVLNFCFMPPPHTDIALSEKIFALLNEWGIEEKFFTITLDNATSNDVSVDALQCQLNLRGLLPAHGVFFHLRCCAHILNLIVQAGLKSIDDAVGKIRDSIKYVKASQQRRQKFLECVKLVSMGSRKGLSQDVITRWNSTYLMIESAVFYRCAFQHLALSDSNYKLCLSTEEWERVQKIANFLKGFYKATLLFSGTKYPTSNLYFPAIFECYVTLKNTVESGDKCLKCMALEMWNKFQKYWYEFSHVLGIALVLDPRYKLEFVAFCYNKAFGTNSREFFSLRAKLDDLFNEYKIKVDQSANTPSPNSNALPKAKTTMDVDESDLFKEFDDTTSDLLSTASIKSELELYLDEHRMKRSDSLDVLSYWKTNQCRYPVLATIARDVLCIPVSTVASESAFSVGGRVLNDFWSSLKPKTAEAIVCTRDWLFGNEDGTKKVNEDMEELIQDVMDLSLEEEKTMEHDSNSG